jgi:hypothetical protein
MVVMETELSNLEEGDIAIVTTKSGRRFVAVWTLAPGIDYFWHPVIHGTAPSALKDPDVGFVVIGTAL